MPDITGWIVSNVKGAKASDGLAPGIPFAIWQRQWEICDIIGDRVRARNIAQRASAAAEGVTFYALPARRYQTQLLIYSGEYKKALELAEESLAQALKLSDTLQLAEIYEQLSQADHNLSNFKQAGEYNQKAGDIYRAAGDNEKLSLNLTTGGMIFWKMGQYPKALEILKQVSSEFGHKSNDRFSATLLTSMASVLLAMDRADEAMEHYLRALEICRRIGDTAKQSALFNNIGSILLRKGDYSAALENFQRGLKLDQTLGNLTGQAVKLGNMAVLQASMGQHDQALANFERALAIDRATGNLDGQVRKLVNMSSLQGLRGDYSLALDHIDEALEICRKINSRSYLGYALSQKIEYLGQLARGDQAIELADEAIAIGREVGNQSQLVNLYNNLAGIYLDNGEAARSLEYSGEAIKIIESQDLFEVNKEYCYFNHSRALEVSGRTGEALTYLDRAHNEVLTKVKEITDEKERARLIATNHTLADIMKKWQEKFKATT